jgi:hypothetical protein
MTRLQNGTAFGVNLLKVLLANCNMLTAWQPQKLRSIKLPHLHADGYFVLNKTHVKYYLQDAGGIQHGFDQITATAAKGSCPQRSK